MLLSAADFPRAQLAAAVGDVLLFDLRLRHRGRANRSAKNRAILGLAHDWYRDPVKIHEVQSDIGTRLARTGRPAGATSPALRPRTSSSGALTAGIT